MQKKFINEALEFHSRDKAGKISIATTKNLITGRDLSLAYSPGVAAPCLEIAEDKDKMYAYTSKGNFIAVISNGTAVLGLGNIGAAASKPVMEGKAALFKRFADIDAIDIEVSETNPEKFINIVQSLQESWGGINLEDIKAPDCFIIERELQKLCSVPVFHDDQHGTAIVVAAGLINAADITGRKFQDLKVVINGPGAAGIACGELLRSIGIKNILYCDRKGVLNKNRDKPIYEWQQFLAVESDAYSLQDALKGADVFLGLSGKNALSTEMLMGMSKNPIVFAMANPHPEIMPEIALKARPDVIIATGRSDYNNQINNLMAFPFIFRGALDVRAKEINVEMKIAAAKAIANLAKDPVPEEVLASMNKKHLSYGKEYIIASPFDPRLINVVSIAVAKAAVSSGVARLKIKDWREYEDKLIRKVRPEAVVFGALYGEVRNNNRRIIFAEGEEEPVVRAAINLRDNNYARPVLVGDKKKIVKQMNDIGMFDLSGIEIINAAISKHNDLYVDYMYNKLKRSGYIYRDCVRLVKNDRNVFSACMLSCNHGDSLVAGITRNFKEVFETLIKILPACDNLFFGLRILIAKGRVLFVADTSVINEPNALQLSKIASIAAQKVKKLGHIPRVAFVSCSSFGASESDGRFKEAVALLDVKKVDFEYEGPMSVDLALNNDKLKKIYPFCKLKDNANVLVMPNVEAADAMCKLFGQIENEKIIGPILIGINKSVQILQIDSNIYNIMDAAIWAASESITDDKTPKGSA